MTRKKGEEEREIKEKRAVVRMKGEGAIPVITLSPP
jgi:hypothetical protein